MANELYPVFDIPDVDEEEEEQAREMKAGPLFDYEIGDFVLDGQNRVIYVNGRDNYMLWCLKALKTQLGACKAYPYFGIDYEDATNQPDRAAVESNIERTIIEALMENPITEKVSNFVFDWDSDELYVTFVVQPYNWDSFDIYMNVVA